MANQAAQHALARPRDATEARALADSVGFWWHSLDLGHGVVTDGVKSPDHLGAELAALRLPDLHGKSVLDVGAWDGFYAFACERCGASRVVALDRFAWSIDLPVFQARYRQAASEGRVTPDPTADPALWRPDELPGKRGFDIAQAALKSAVQPVVADLDAQSVTELGSFDVVLYLGVIYHIRNPLAALRTLRAATGELAIIESETFALGGADDRPLVEFVGGGKRLADPTNWWIPNRAALAQLCLTAGFSRAEHVTPPPAELSPGELLRTRTVIHAWP